MTPLPGAPAPGADDLERRLAAALNPELTHLVADAAALRAHARAGSRRIRRRRRVAAGALTVVALGGLSALALPRHQDPSPVPLPVATPTVTPTGVTTQPSPSGTPTGTPSLQLSTTAPTATPTGTASHTTQGRVIPQGTGTLTGTTRPPAAARPTTRPAPTTMDPTFGAFKVGDWVRLSADGYTPQTQGNYPLWYPNDSEVKIILSEGSCRGVSYISNEGQIAGRWWEFTGPLGETSSEAVTVWERGRAREALARVLRCWPDNGAQLVRNGDWYIEANFWDYELGSKTTEVRAFAVSGDAVISLFLELTGTRDEIVTQVHALLDPVVATVKQRGLH